MKKLADDPQASLVKKQNVRAQWTIVDAIWWVHNLPGNEEPPLQLAIPSLRGAMAYPASPGSREWIDAATAVLEVLRGDQISAFRIAIDGSAKAILAGFWNKKRVQDDPDYEQILVPAADAKQIWPGAIAQAPRKSHEEVVEWCREWIQAGKGNGEDKAWPALQKDPAHKGLARDGMFRPAWREAKGKKTK